MEELAPVNYKLVLFSLGVSMDECACLLHLSALCSLSQSTHLLRQEVPPRERERRGIFAAMYQFEVRVGWDEMSYVLPLDNEAPSWARKVVRSHDSHLEMM